MVTIRVRKLYDFCMEILTSVGVKQEEAHIITESLIEADQRGVHSHGVVCLSRYVNLIREGLMKPNMEYDVVRQMGAVQVWNGKRSNGQALGHAAMERAIELARDNGVGVVAVTHGNHFGAGAYYAQLARKQGMIGIAMSTGSPTMAPWGGAEKAIGNNPVAVAVPTSGETPVLLDMAQSVVAAGKVTNLAKQGAVTVPEGWILDKNGEPTTKMEDYYSVMPLGAYKGFGMSLIVDILSGILFGGETGARALDGQDGPSFLMMAWNIEAFQEKDVFYAQMEDRITELKSVRKAAHSAGVMMPGEPEEKKFRASGTEAEVLPEVLAEMNALAKELGVGARV